MAKTKLSRRAVLRCAGIAGATIALPALEAMVKRPGFFYGQAAGQSVSPTKKLILYHWPQGAPTGGYSINSQTNTFFPKNANTTLSSNLTTCLQPLSRHADKINLLSGLTYGQVAEHVLSHGHCVGLMTGYRNFEMPGKNLSAARSASVDQIAAQKIGSTSPVPALSTVLYADRGEACPMSWTRGTSLTDAQFASAINKTLWDPIEVYNKVFQPFANGGDPAAAAAAERIKKRKQSLLDFAKRDIERIKSRVGKLDQQRMDAHLETFRDIERQIQIAAVTCNDASGFEGQGKPYQSYSDSEAPTYAKLMRDMHLLALRCDITNVSYFSMGPTGTNRIYPFAGVNYPHHCIAHSGDGCPDLHQKPGDSQTVIDQKLQVRTDAYTKVVAWYMDQLALLIDELVKTDGSGTSLLDQCALVAFSEFADANTHYENYVPMLVAGKAGATTNAMVTGKQLCFPIDFGEDWKNAPWLASLPGTKNRSPVEVWDSALKAVGALKTNEKFGDPANNVQPLPGLWI